MRVGQNAWGIQFHVELEPTTIPEWGAVPAYAEALEATLGCGAMAGMESAAEPHFSGFRRNAERLLENFLAVTM
jgi:GMP synthase-like glutamine amidotransferase